MDQNIGKVLRLIRKYRGFTLRELGKKREYHIAA